MHYPMPRIVIAGLSGGSGKTMLSTGLARAFSRSGLTVQSFKKGPDYIDTLWLGLAARCTPRNLDPYMTPSGLLPHIFASACEQPAAEHFNWAYAQKWQGAAQQENIKQELNEQVSNELLTDLACNEPLGSNLPSNKLPAKDLFGAAFRAEQGRVLPLGGQSLSWSCKGNRQSSSALWRPDIAIIEGNRGIFDGQDIQGSCSTAEVARQLSAPVILVMNCAKMTRTAAAIVQGIKNFEPGLNLAGVILNRVSRSRHRSIVKQAVEELAGLKVLGLIPSCAAELFEERQSGLYSAEAVNGSAEAMKRLDALANFVAEHVDLEAILALAQSAPPLEVKKRPDGWFRASEAADYSGDASTSVSGAAKPAKGTVAGGSAEYSGLAASVSCRGSEQTFGSDEAAEAGTCDSPFALAGAVKAKARIAYVRDAAFWFYYAENLEALEQAGAELIQLSILDEKAWPEFDALYIGGGFPGEYAAQLAANKGKKEELAALVRGGLPTYAEGPGFYYLTRAIELEGVAYPMAGIFDFELKLGKVPRGIGYVQALVEKPNPFHPVGTLINAHEFHYTDIGMPGDRAAESLLHMNKGTGMFYTKGQPGRDGLLKYNCFISHMQLYAPGAPHWATNFVNAALDYCSKS